MTKRTMIEFRVFGSVTDLSRAHDVGDIDLVVPEFTGNPESVSLEVYERLAEATGKPIDLKFSMHPSELNLMGWYEPPLPLFPGGRWEFHRMLGDPF